MSKLPVLSSIKLIKILAKLGYQVDHQTGSHIILRNTSSPFRRITIPNHKEISRGTLLAIIEETRLTRMQFLKLLD